MVTITGHDQESKDHPWHFIRGCLQSLAGDFSGNIRNGASLAAPAAWPHPGLSDRIPASRYLDGVTCCNGGGHSNDHSLSYPGTY